MMTIPMIVGAGGLIRSNLVTVGWGGGYAIAV
jgi:hypothetical protein